MKNFHKEIILQLTIVPSNNDNVLVQDPKVFVLDLNEHNKIMHNDMKFVLIAMHILGCHVFTKL